MSRTYLALAAALFTQPAFANGDGFYLKVFGGASMLSDTDVTLSGSLEPDVSFGSGSTFGGAVGYGYENSPISAELEFAYRSGDSESGATSGGDFASTALMLNGVWSFGQSGRLSPYAGAGLGYVTEIDFDVPGAGEFNDRGGIAWQVFGGVSYAVSERASLFGELRYFDAGSRTLDGVGGSLDADYSTIDVVAGVTFSF